jgi:hypothetical protein
MSEFKYAQCLIKIKEKGTETAWIPIKFARRHQKVILGDKTRGVRGQIIEVGNKTERDMAKYSGDWKKARKRTDI